MNRYPTATSNVIAQFRSILVDVRHSNKNTDNNSEVCILFPASKLVRISRLSFVGWLFEDVGEPVKQKVVELFWVLEMWPVGAMQRLVKKSSGR